VLAKKYRLTAKKDFQHLYKNRKSYQTEFFFVKYLANTLDHSRFAVVISKKVAARAVDRNKNKRRIKAVLQHYYQAMSCPVDMVFYIKKDMKELSFADIQKVIAIFLKSQGLITTL